MSTYAFAGFGGSETYLLTTAEQLERLGHRVSVRATETGPMTVHARARGIRVAESDADLPAAPDAVIAQDAHSSLLLARRYPEAPQLFISHADAIDLQGPPRLPGVVSGVAVFNERVAERVRSSTADAEIFRLRQPVDVDLFAPAGVSRPRPKRLLMFSNYLRGPRRALLEQACADAGIEVVQVGAPATVLENPSRALQDADIVVGYGRSILEAMACGRAAYVFDHKGADGWVTPESYPALESDGFGGRARSAPVTPEALRADLGAYHPEMGLANRDLVVANHSSHRHAAELVDVLRRLGPRARPLDDLAEEVARAVRVQWQAEHRAMALAQENEALREEFEILQARSAESERRLRRITSTRWYRVSAAARRRLHRWG